MSTPSAPLTPGPPAPITIWRFNLAQELVATAVAGLALLGGAAGLP